MTTQLHQITITAHDGGWWAHCSKPGCEWNVWHQRRPAVDLAAHNHQKKL